ncbi:hypothetical protein ACLB2K_068586 [Fragaria x ananassa]
MKTFSTSRAATSMYRSGATTTSLSLTTRYKRKSPAALKFVKSWHEQTELARTTLHKAATRMRKCADKNRRYVEFKEGDLVLVKLLPQQFKCLRKVHKGLVHKYEEPFEIIKCIGNVSYKLHLPPKLKIIRSSMKIC